MSRTKRSRARTPERLGFAAATLMLLAWSLAPALWQLSTALKPDAQITRTPTIYLPRPPTFRHFAELWHRRPFASYLAQSLRISTAATAISVLLAALAASALSDLGVRARRRLLGGLLLLAVFPPILLLFPLYEGLRALGWLNHSISLILPYAALSLPLSIWIMDAGYRQIPREIGEAAELDGLSPLGRVLRIELPLALPSAAAAALLVFIFCWNEFLLALTFLTRDDTKTVTAGIASIGSASIYEIPWGQLSAAISVATAPLVLLVFLFERRITSGLTRGAVKG